MRIMAQVRSENSVEHHQRKDANKRVGTEVYRDKVKLMCKCLVDLQIVGSTQRGSFATTFLLKSLQTEAGESLQWAELVERRERLVVLNGQVRACSIPGGVTY